MNETIIRNGYEFTFDEATGTVMVSTSDYHAEPASIDEELAWQIVETVCRRKQVEPKDSILPQSESAKQCRTHEAKWISVAALFVALVALFRRR